MDTQRRIEPVPTDPQHQRPPRTRTAFRIVSWITALWILAMSFFGLFELVLMWLPESSVGSIVGEDPTLPPIALHRSHFMAIGIVAWIIVLGAFVQLRRPERRTAPMLQLLAAVLGGTVVYGLSGTLGEWFLEEWTLLIPVVAMALLHPRARDLLSRAAFDRRMLVAAAVGAAPWLVFAVQNSRLQLIGSNLDPHHGLEHWAVAGLMGFLIAACALIGSTDKDSWQLPAWLAAGASVVFGAHSLAFPGLASGLAQPVAVLAIGWGVVFAITIVLRSRGSADATA